jgi:hypothetical protein
MADHIIISIMARIITGPIIVIIDVTTGIIIATIEAPNAITNLASIASNIVSAIRDRK